jgi:hypothetical protein
MERSSGEVRRWRWPTRSIRIGELQDAFLVSAVTMIIVIRFQLWATNYPQLGSGKLHIAHLLWGGLLMLIGLGMLISFAGQRVRLPAAIVGGLGFGFFIDELGKFITSDNDYFYKPAAAIIYLIFVVLYLLTRWMQSRRTLSPREALINAADMIGDAADRGFDEREKRQALALLAQADPGEPLTGQLTTLVREIETVGPHQPGRVAKLVAGIRDRYAALVERPRFARVVSTIFIVWAAVTFVGIVMLGLAAAFSLGGLGDLDVAGPGGDGHLSFIDLASLAASLASGTLVILGALRMRKGDRLGAYEQFDRALMVEILIGAFFSFAEIQFSAVFGLGLNVLLLITVRLMIDGEREMRAPEPPARGRAAGLAERLRPRRGPSAVRP